MFHPSDHNVELSEEEFRLLRDFIHEKFGLHFDDNQRASLKSRLAGRLASLDLLSYEDYYHFLRFAPQRNEELQRMVSHLTNNETYFFRESPQLSVLENTVLKGLKDRKARDGSKSLRLLSAGCSTGEEAYTLAMVVYDSGQFFWGWDVQITGLDVDHVALEKASRAIYFHNSFRSVPAAVSEKHFAKDAASAGMQVRENIRKLVRFRQGNLLEPESYAGLQPLDVIFCRNVLIYFSDATILKVVKQFHRILDEGGYLFLGHAESLSRITDLFTPIRFQGAMVYQKSSASGAWGEAPR
jgi:chemotaxis protein methyltransferase CheR